MSTILKALRRLEQEKSTASNRPLSEALANAPVPPAPPRKRRRLWLVVSSGGVAAAAVAAFLLLSDRPGEQAAQPAQVAAADAVVAPHPSPPARVRSNGARPPQPPQPAVGGAPSLPSPVRTAPSDLGYGAPDSPQRQPSLFRPSAKPSRELPPAALSSEVEVVSRVQPVKPPGTVTGPPAGDLPAQPPSDRVAVERPAPKPVRRPAVPAEAPVVAASPTRAPTAVSANTRPPETTPPPTPQAVEKPAPEPTEVASVAPKKAVEPRVKQVPRSPVPDLNVERTVWHPLAERRVAVVTLQDSGEVVELHEGDAIGPLVVRAIEPTAVVFLHDGVELRRRIGSR